MDILEVLGQIRELLQQKGRITYRILKMQFQLDDEQLGVLKDELVEGEQVATDENGKVLVWVGDEEGTPTPAKPQSQTQPPASYPPPH